MTTPRPIRTHTLLLAVLLALGLSSARLHADATVKGVNEGKGLGGGGESVSYIKGLRMRVDQTVGGKLHTTVIDADAGRMIVIDHAKKRAEVTDARDVQKALESVSGSEIHAQLKPTGRSQVLLGQKCDEYMVTVRFQFSPVPEQPLTMVMSGPAWIAKNSPGAQDYRSFYEAAVEKGLFFGDPKAAQAQPGPTKGFTELYRAMAETGVPYSTNLKTAFEGSGPMVALMNKMGASSITTRVTEVSTEALSDDLFEIPAGYKVKNR